MTSSPKLDRIESQRNARLADLDAAVAFRALRTLHGLTQQQVANMLYRSLRNIQQLEWAEVPIDPAILELFHHKLSLLYNKGE